MGFSDYGFPKACRLRSSADFQRVFSEARRSADRCLVVLGRQSGADRARLGLAISKKNIRKATDRNRLKRLIRESFRLYQQDLAGIDLVVMARKEALLADPETLRRSLQKHWGRLLKQCKPCCSSSSSSIAT